MKTYLDLLDHVLTNGVPKGDRTGTGTLSTFGYQMRFDLSAGFPLLTTKRVHTRSVIAELLWFIQGVDQRQVAAREGVTIWDEWADADGELGPIYGYQWRSWPDSGRPAHRPAGRRDRLDQGQSRLAPAPGQRLERRRAEPDGAAAVPHDVPVLRRPARRRGSRWSRAAVLPALPAIGRRLPRRSVQHRLVRAAHPSGGPGLRPGRRRLRAHPRRRAPLPESPRSGPTPAHPGAARRCRS